MPPVKSSVFENFLKLSKGKDGNCRAACKYYVELERERELELKDFERNWNYKKRIAKKKELELN